MITAALTACSGGDESSADGGGADTTVTTSSLSKTEFVKSANRICDRDRPKLVTELLVYVEQHKGEGKTEIELVNDGAKVIFLPRIQGQIEEIRALGAPNGDEQQVEEILVALQEGVDTGGRFEFKDFKRSAKLLRAYGIDSCAYSN